MATWIDVSVVQSNKCVLNGKVADADGNVLDLTNYTLQLIIKASETANDNTGTTYAPTVTNARLGEWSLTIAGSAFGTAQTQWYRLDVVDGGGAPVTVNLGNLKTVAA